MNNGAKFVYAQDLKPGDLVDVDLINEFELVVSVKKSKKDDILWYYIIVLSQNKLHHHMFKHGWMTRRYETN